MAPADDQQAATKQQTAAASLPEPQRQGSKREVPAEGAEAQGREQAPRRAKPPSFKVMGHLVMAMKRFSNSLNPTYTYGKRTTSPTTSGSRRSTAQEGDAQRPVTSRPTSPEEKDKYAFPDHGHRFDFLLKPLPPTEEEEAQRA